MHRSPASRAITHVVLPLFGLLFSPAAHAHLEATPPRATRLLVKKGAHTLVVYDGESEVRSYSVAIGPGGSGPKRREGDAVTPVGHYRVTMHQPSKYKIFMRLDYPNADDRKRFAAAKVAENLPKNARIGGDIGIHGAPPDSVWKTVHKTVDWTLGCIALDDDEIVELAGITPDGTAVDIED